MPTFYQAHGGAILKKMIPVVNLSGKRQRLMPELDIPTLPGAACRDADINPDLFHPEDGRASKKKIQQAKDICEECPVKQKCLDWCLNWEYNNGEIQPGIWGGTTEWERRDMDRPLRELCQKGLHELIGDNAMPLPGGGRRCRECFRKAHREGKVRRYQEAKKIGA